MNSDEENDSFSETITVEKKFNIKTDKKNEMDLYLRIYGNDEFAISIYSKNEYPSRKFEIRTNLVEIQKNRFFKIFFNFDEIMKELEDKISKSFFFEENEIINIVIPIGLIVIDSVNISANLVEKTNQEINQELRKKIKEQFEEIKNLKSQINNNNNFKNQINEKDKIIKKLRDDIMQQKKNYEKIILKERELIKQKEEAFRLEERKRKEEEERKRRKEKVQNRNNLSDSSNYDSNNILTNEEMEQIYDEIEDDFNISEFLNKAQFIIKLKDLIKKEKDNYKGMDKKEIIYDLKEKVIDTLY